MKTFAPLRLFAFLREARSDVGTRPATGTKSKIPMIYRRRSARLHASSLITIICIALISPLSVAAQTGSSSVRGAVLDPQGQAIAGANVSLIAVETGTARTQTTNERGEFVFDLVQPGIYRIETEAAGFKKTIISDIRALVAKPTEVEVKMVVGEISDSVSVSASSGDVLINAQDASIGNNFVSQQIIQLPLESRNVVQLLSLQPGVTPDGYVTGSRSDQANITLDGVDVNEQQTGLDVLDGAAFASVLRVTPDSVQEFRVTTSNPNATLGRSSGAQVSLITNGGSNEFHGSLYEFHRNTATSANDFFNNRAGIDTPKLLRNVFGGSIGGPIKKDRAFFFYTYEGRRDSSEETAVRTVPLASLGRGEVRFPNDAGGVTTLRASDINSLFPAGVNPIGLAALADAAARFPANDNTVGDGFNTGGFRFNAQTPLRLNAHIARLDINLTQDARHILFLRGNYQYDLVDRAPQFPGFIAPSLWSHPVGFVAGHTWSMGGTKVNNFRYGLTRLAFSDFGDAARNHVSFRFVFSPDFEDANESPARTLIRTTPVHNFIDDFSWVRGSHNYQFGANVRVIRNNRINFAGAFDTASINPSFYDFSGAVLSDPIEGIDPGFISPVQNAVAAVIGRFSEYTANFNFDREGNLLPVGTGVERTFGTEEYDFYLQDTWRVRPSFTVTAGLRYGLSRPVYETNGVQVKPTISLSDFFERRKAGALEGNPLNELITVDLAGPKNDRDGYYDWDFDNFQPRIAFAWSPNYKEGWLGRLFGADGTTVLRGGFAITNDAIGQQLAVQFDLNSTLGFSSSQTIAANTFNVTDRLGPRFESFSQNVRNLDMINIPAGLVFPLLTPADEAQRIESSLDDAIRSPINYTWNFSWGRRLPAGTFVEASYIGRLARNLLATRDIMALNNLVDPSSDTDWYTAAGRLHDLRAANTPLNRVPNIPYFSNLFPGLGPNLAALFEEPAFQDLTPTQAAFFLVARDGFDILDWTFVQLLLDDFSSIGPNVFFHPQYAALSTFSTVASSDYHAGTLSVRQRRGDSLSLDFNYTLSKSIDNASGLQTSTSYGTAFILNPLRPEDNRAVSDFDVRHIINANGIWQLPIGRGRRYMSDVNPMVDTVLGGWQLSGIFRWNSGFPIPTTPTDAAQWATNWNVQSFGTRRFPIESSPTRGGATAPNLFSDPVAAYRSFRNARPGETGDRNVLRAPGFVSLDLGLGKSFRMPWSENHRLQFRWEIFNVTNTQRLTITPEGVTRETFGLNVDPELGTPPPVFGNLNEIQGTPRVMQFGLRYQF